MAPQSEQLERETEAVRADLSHTLDELRERMTTGQLVDQVIDYTREGEVAAMLGNLRRQVVENPLALGLIGAGVAWLMIPTRKSDGGVRTGHYGRRLTEYGRSAAETAADYGGRASEYGGRAAEQIKEAGADASARLQNASGRVMDAGAGAMEAAGNAADRLKETATAGADTFGATARQAGGRVGAMSDRLGGSARSAAEGVSEGYDRLAHTAGETSAQVSQSVSSLGRNVAATTRSAGQNFMDACRDQPLILAGLGLAIGAALGAAFPRSETEDRLMGATSDDVKETAQAVGSEKMEQAKAFAGETMEEAKEFAGERMKQAKEGVQEIASEMEQAATARSGDTPSIVPSPDEKSTGESATAGREPGHGGH